MAGGLWGAGSGVSIRGHSQERPPRPSPAGPSKCLPWAGGPGGGGSEGSPAGLGTSASPHSTSLLWTHKLSCMRRTHVHTDTRAQGHTHAGLHPRTPVRSQLRQPLGQAQPRLRLRPRAQWAQRGLPRTRPPPASSRAAWQWLGHPQQKAQPLGSRVTRMAVAPHPSSARQGKLLPGPAREQLGPRTGRKPDACWWGWDSPLSRLRHSWSWRAGGREPRRSSGPGRLGRALAQRLRSGGSWRWVLAAP